MPVKAREFDRVLTTKGFTSLSQNGHKYFYLWDLDGKQTLVRTRRSSHGNLKDISDDIISAMYKQLHFASKADFMKFFECTVSHQEYVSCLKMKGII
ncbi:MAG: hypothetical protein NTV68_16510 [Methanomicrobiales archaeon]|nr:hypothetical protein [Methanomicrobiales archaeon]